MTSDPQPSLGQRIYRALFTVFGPADVGPAGPPAVGHPDDPTVPAGYHLQTISDGSGIRRRIAVPHQPAPESRGPKQADLKQADPEQSDSKQADEQ